MKYTKIRNVKSPTRANATDAGIDFFVPEWSEEFKNSVIEKNVSNGIGFDITLQTIIVPPQHGVLIPAGVKVKVPEGFALIAFNKSGIATKQQLLAGACVVDEDYRGEVHINVINTGKRTINIAAGSKLMQFLLIEVNNEMPEEISNEEYSMFENTSRGAGGFGSTGTK